MNKDYANWPSPLGEWGLFIHCESQLSCGMCGDHSSVLTIFLKKLVPRPAGTGATPNGGRSQLDPQYPVRVHTPHPHHVPLSHRAFSSHYDFC